MVLDMFNLKGKVAVVTGARTGLGQGMAIGLAEAGADMVLVNHSPMPETEKMIKVLGRRCIAIEAELSDINVIPGIIEKTIKEFGRIDILVNNAGIIRRAPSLEFSEKDWDDVIELNLKSVFFLSQAAAKEMVKQGGGKIINIASMLSFQGGILIPSYAASKGGIASLTKTLANEWAKYNINVNAIAPGYMETNNTEPLRKNEGRYKSISERIPAGRWGKPEDLKGAVVFLASKASDYVTGHILCVDGGWLAR
ncbi:2-deoxy-D-gluconate 3-dehydrogenase [Thermoanaerobacteraceae bacterium SP2]|jgi:2-deoxy-D-gluconate 3-dehydrogenase|nr:2-dehydro-3-deoxy-D-gluconate 5-dehydrogenase [Clostridiales bacterium]RKL63636.1 2-deoxy-D-gluconate 3-dehydrogenase [Thermoanaerobacteraceae bacterium SP2]